MTKSLLKIFCMAAFLTSCGRTAPSEEQGRSEARSAAETRAEVWLARARAAFSLDDFKSGKELIDSIRREARLALDAREWAILLLDSIELREAQLELGKTDSLVQAGTSSDSLTLAFEEQVRRVKFYQRKLEHDRTNWRKH